uniref:Putative zinc ion binding protein n=1 Tax=Corethrella appendiculata TaxID=1370023 RepID=U5EM65_9DIPT
MYQLSKENYLNCCRICLATEASTFIDIFTTTVNDSALYFYEAISHMIGRIMKIENNGNMPRHICINCAYRVSNATNLIDLANKSELILYRLKCEDDEDFQHQVNGNESGRPCESPVYEEQSENIATHSGNNANDTIEEQQEEQIQADIIEIPDIKYVPELDVKNPTSENQNTDELVTELSSEFIPLVVIPKTGSPQKFENSMESENHLLTRSHEVVFEDEQPQIVIKKLTPRTLKKYTGKKHVNKHYYCSECGKSFKQKSNLEDHFNFHSGIRKYKCTICPKSFVQQGNLRAHLRTHSKERPYKCNQCFKAFSQSSSLKIHLRMHENVKDFVCEVCNKIFYSSSDLSKHKWIHSEIKPYKCVACNPITHYNQKAHLVYHLKKYHSDMDATLFLADEVCVNIRKET